MIMAATPTMAYRPRPPLNRRALAVTAIAALLMTVLVWRIQPTCLDLVVASSNEKFELLRNLANTYEAPPVDRRCVDVRITLVPSGTAERDLARDWRGLPDRPHVSSPAATTWLLLLSEDRRRRGLDDILPPVAQSLIQSPLVIAMPQEMASTLRQSSDRLGWHDLVSRARDPAGWARFGKPWGAFRLGQTTPHISTSGLHAMISLNNAAQVEADPQAFLTDLDASVLHYADSVKTFLVKLHEADRHLQAMSYVSAIAVEEKQVFDYNRGNPDSTPCEVREKPTCDKAKPHEKLVAIYPKEGTLYADHPYAILNWRDQADAELYVQAALDFERYLETRDSQEYFQSQGFRNHRRQAGDRLTPPFFDPTEPKALYAAPPPSVIRQMLDRWTTQIRKPASAFMLLDLDVPTEALSDGRSKLSTVKDAIRNALGVMGPGDAIGLRTLPTRTGDAYRELLPITTLQPPPSKLALPLDQLEPVSGKRSLYASIRAAVEAVRSDFSPKSVNAVVVVTNGGDETTDSRDALLDWLRQQSERRVLVFIVALSAAASDLKDIADATGGIFYEASDGKGIEDAVRKALLNL